MQGAARKAYVCPRRLPARLTSLPFHPKPESATMAEISASQAAQNAFASSVEYYADGLRRCDTRDETKWRDRRDAAQRVVDVIAEYETTLAYWREPHALES